MPNIRGPELLILVLVVLLLFGAKRLPDAARSVGRSLRIFKAETKGLMDSDSAPESPATAAAAPPVAPVALPGAPQGVTPPVSPVSGVPDVGAGVGDTAVAPQADAAPSSVRTPPPSQA
jgi:sec-independent protein translocase protein TatA